MTEFETVYLWTVTDSMTIVLGGGWAHSYETAAAAGATYAAAWIEVTESPNVTMSLPVLTVRGYRRTRRG